MQKKLIFSVFSVLIFVVGMAVPIIAETLTDRDELMQSSSLGRTTYSAPAASGPRTSPFDPNEENDSNFVTDDAPKLDTGCIFRSSGPIVYDILVSRYVGELNSDGTLKNASELIKQGIISKEATLIMPVYDVDSNAVTSPPIQPEIDRVLFNGEEIGFLSGENNTWKLNSFQIPIEKVKFANKSPSGTCPLGALNEVKIEIDTGNSDEQWCTSVDWGAGSFRAMPPVILIHGNGSDGEFWDRRGFTQALRNNFIPYDNSIELDRTSVANNGKTLGVAIPGVAGTMGVQNIQIVAHSKGGLDTREFLASYYPSLEKSKELKIHTFTTLSTPHKGSVLADYTQTLYDSVFQLDDENERTSLVDWTTSSFDSRNKRAANLDLTTQETAKFNTTNRLPSNIQYYSVGADADIDDNDHIEPEEYRSFMDEADLIARNLSDWIIEPRINTAYQTLGNFRSAKAEDTGRQSCSMYQGNQVCIPIFELTETETSSFQENDLLVTVNCAKHNDFSFIGQVDKNHSSVADGDVAEVVIKRLKRVQ